MMKNCRKSKSPATKTAVRFFLHGEEELEVWSRRCCSRKRQIARDTLKAHGWRLVERVVA